MGNFFDELDLGIKKNKVILKTLPPIPHTGWTPPKEFPDLSSATTLSFDVETKELDFEHGPGWARNKGHIVGLGIGAMDNFGNRGSWYFPLRHEVQTELNLEPHTVFNWARNWLENRHIPKVGANLIYDIGWLTEENIFVEGELHDVQFAEALLDEDARVALNVLGHKYLGIGKATDLMYDWIRRAYKPHKGGERGEIYRTPPSLVGFYGESDVTIPLDVIQRQLPINRQEELGELYRMECDLIPLWVRMRRAGVQIDLNRAESLYSQLNKEVEVLYAKLSLQAGFTVPRVSSADELGFIFDKLGIKYPITDKTKKPSITKDWLKELEHPIGQIIRDIRMMEKIRDTFIKAYMLERHVNGKVHASFNPLRGGEEDNEDGVGKTSRLSSSNPNLQNIPKRSVLGKEMRKMFIADKGHYCFGAGDQSQVEYRGLVHFAVGKGSDEVRAQYINDPKTDYHETTRLMVKEIGGVELPRNGEEAQKLGIGKTIKEINFGLLYGMSEYKLGKEAGLDKKGRLRVFKAYHESAPYVKETMQACSDFVQQHGYITTIMGRRTRFKLWEPVERNYNEKIIPLPLDKALEKWGTYIKRANDYKATNYRLQGTAAEILKRAMWLCLKSGVYDVIGVPRLTVHDENGHSVIDLSPIQVEGYNYMIHNMENAIKLRIPLRFDWKIGANWGEC